MTRRTDKNRLLRRIIRAASATLLAIALALSAGASALGASASQTGGPLGQQALGGHTDCARLSSARFVLIGRTVMTRMLGPGAGQNLMTAHMRTVWPAGGLNQAYSFMGRRLAGCAAGNGPRAFGTMMAMMGGGMMGASYGYGTTGYASAAYRPAYMMEGGYGGASTMMRDGLTHVGGLGPATIVATAVGLLVLAAAIASMLVIVRRRTRTAHPHSA